MSGYSKLFSSIVHSTIWREANHIRLVWITMLALKDQDGLVSASIPGLADAARVTIAECEEALVRLASPDRYSRTPDHEGRRIADARGGWRVLNHELYRSLESPDDRRSKGAERVKRFREKHSNNAKKASGSSTTTEALHETPCNAETLHETDCNACNDIQIQIRSDTDQIQIRREELENANHDSVSVTASGPVKPPKRQSKPKSQSVPCPETLDPSPATLRIATELGRDWRKDLDAMRDWALGKGERKVDWEAALRGWMRRAATSKQTASVQAQDSSPAPDGITYTEKHRGLCRRGDMDLGIEWTYCRSRARSSGRLSFDWAAEFEAHLSNRVTWIERDRATRQNGPSSAVAVPATRPSPLPATPGAPETRNEPQRQSVDLGPLLAKIGNPDG